LESPEITYKRLIVDPQNGKFLAPGGKWTTNEAEALDFQDIAAALMTCALQRIEKAEILLRVSGDNGYDVHLPIRHTPAPRKSC
jgi:hypothetical protein